MPRIYSVDLVDEAELEAAYEDDDRDPFLAAPEAFHYLPPPAFGGPPGPVYVKVKSPTDQAEPLASPTIKAAKPTLLQRIFGAKPSASSAAEREAESAEFDRRQEAAAAEAAEALAGLGAVRVICRYDGGNDEGFAWFDHCKMKDGSTLDADGAARALENTSAARSLRGDRSRHSIRELLDDLVATCWAVKLLGCGFGTGEFVMFGAFSVDLQSGLVADDPNPDPIVSNIRFKESG